MQEEQDFNIGRRVVDNAFKKVTRALAAEHQLSVNRVTWEDSSREKGSCWGPNISDMTLRVDNTNMPVIRSPNFEDTTWDVEMSNVSLIVGNEQSGGQTRSVSLDDYLRNFSQYNGGRDLGDEQEGLYCAERDSHVIMSAQSCFVPVPQGGESKFSVSLFNYQSIADDPAVLVLVSSATGTSSQTVGDSSDGNALYFNDAGKKCPFVAARLADDREQRGVGEAVDSKTLTGEEAARNCLLIIQVPLKPQKERPVFDVCYQMESCCAPLDFQCDEGSVETSDIDHAVLRVGDSEGEFPPLPAKMVRDTRYPVRVTLQYYKATSNGVFSSDAMADVAQQLLAARRFGENVGSLVTQGDTGRPTESTPVA